MLASIRSIFASHLTEMRVTADECFCDYYFVLASKELRKKINSCRTSRWKVFYRIGASFLKELSSCRFPAIIITAAMWTILDAAEFLDPSLAFTHWNNDGNFNFNAISLYKNYIDFWIKIVRRLFLNDKQILTECFKSFLAL